MNPIICKIIPDNELRAVFPDSALSKLKIFQYTIDYSIISACLQAQNRGHGKL